MLNLKLGHARKTVSPILLAKAVIGSSFAVLTLCGVALPLLGVDFTAEGELLAAGGGGLLGGALVALRT